MDNFVSETTHGIYKQMKLYKKEIQSDVENIKKVLLDKARTFLKDEVIFSLLWQVLFKLKAIMFETHSSIWLEKNLNDNNQSQEEIGDYEIIFNELDTISEWMKQNNDVYSWMYDEKEYSIAKKYGHVIPFLKHNNKIIGYTKVALNKVYIRDYDTLFSLAPNKAMFYDTTFLPEYRGKHLPRYLKNYIYSYLINRNINYIYAHIEPWNIASIKSNKGIGFKEVCLNRYIRILFFKYHSTNLKKLLQRSTSSN